MRLSFSVLGLSLGIIIFSNIWGNGAFFLFLLKYSCFTMPCQSLPCSTVTQTHTDLLFYTCFPCHYGFSQDVYRGLLCYAVGPWCLSILHTLRLLTPTPQASLLQPPPLGSHESVVRFCFIDTLVCAGFTAQPQTRTKQCHSQKTDATGEHLTKFSSVPSLRRVRLFATP